MDAVAALTDGEDAWEVHDRSASPPARARASARSWPPGRPTFRPSRCSSSGVSWVASPRWPETAETAEAVEARWRRRFGADVVDTLRRSLADVTVAMPWALALAAVLLQSEALRVGLEPPPGCWRAERRHRAHTRRLLADPVATLPRHPMVLHRGGWPDGS